MGGRICEFLNREFGIFLDKVGFRTLRCLRLITSMKNSVGYIVHAIFFVLAPFLTTLMICLIDKINHPGQRRRFFLMWNDEAAYFSLAKSFAAYGRPLGYWAYDGLTAKISTGGPWGHPIIAPYGLFAKFFTWTPGAAVCANCVF